MLRLGCALFGLGAALAGLVLAVRCTLDDKVSGGHLVLAALVAVWAAQRGLEYAWRRCARERDRSN
jgi:steroid 5-alpha reductase family enzyme